MVQRNNLKLRFLPAIPGTNALAFALQAEAAAAAAEAAADEAQAAIDAIADAEYVVSATHANLTAERLLTDTPSIVWDFTTLGQAKANATGITAADEVNITLVDGVTVPLDASLGNVFELTAAGDRTILTPNNAPIGNRTQKLIIHHKASGANRLLALTTGVGAFRFGTTITGLTTTTSGLTDWIGCLWNQADTRWDVVAYAKGF